MACLRWLTSKRREKPPPPWAVPGWFLSTAFRLNVGILCRLPRRGGTHGSSIASIVGALSSALACIWLWFERVIERLCTGSQAILETTLQQDTDGRMRDLDGRGRVFEASGISRGLSPGRRCAPPRPPIFSDFTRPNPIRIASWWCIRQVPFRRGCTAHQRSLVVGQALARLGCSREPRRPRPALQKTCRMRVSPVKSGKTGGRGGA